MSLKLPPMASPLRSLFNTADLAEIAHPYNRCEMLSLPQAKAAGLRMIESGASAAHVICMTCDGHIRLVRVGPKGGLKRLWDFGQG